MLTALALVCAARGGVELVGSERMSALRARLAAASPSQWPRPVAAGATLVAALAFGALVFARRDPCSARRRRGHCSWRDGPTSRDRGHQRERRCVYRSGDGRNDRARHRRRPAHRVGRAATEGSGARSDRRQRHVAGLALVADARAVVSDDPGAVRRRAMVMSLHRGTYQGPPTVVANLEGTLVASTYGEGQTFVSREDPRRFRRTVELALEHGRYRIVGSEGGLPQSDACRNAGQRNARRRLVRERRQPGRARLPPGRIPLRRLQRPDRDDGRRALLARLRRRRLARPLRRQLVRRPTSPPGRSTAAFRGARSSTTSAGTS